MTTTERGWAAGDVAEIPPVKPDWPQSWKSVRAHFGLTGFGINAVTKNAGEVLIPEHDETPTRQEEVYFVHEGEAVATVDGAEVTLPAGHIIAIQRPEARRSLRATATPTTLLCIGGAPGRAYTVGDWEK
jgi:uncharacterized cupin superfamily protein